MKPPINPPHSTLKSLLVASLGITLLSSQAFAQLPLDNYDAAINNDAGLGTAPTATLLSPVSFTGGAGSSFDFGAVSGDATVEFIVEGDPSANNSAYLAVGQNTASSLRYEVWDNTGELGFTQSRVADYQFSPGVASVKKPSHVAYVWDPATTTVTLYLNGSKAGTVTGVDPAFALPTGVGRLGSNENNEEGMVGTIHRVTVYDSALTPADIRRHADAFGGEVLPALEGYDAGINTDAGAGLAPVIQQSSTIILPSSGTTPFDFGVTTDDVTIEFILKGDISVNNSAFLAVGEFRGASLRYELWDNTGQLGFTRNAVADYQFSPGVTSPSTPTHVTYSWNSVDKTMKVYINGVLAGTATGVANDFVMPSGAGFLGSNESGGERMTGIIYRVTVYDDLLTDEAILRHGKAFADVLQPPVVKSFTANVDHIAPGATAKLSWSTDLTKSVTINGVPRTGTSLDVTPEVTTTYTLVALNEVGTANAKLTVYVVPKLDAYDAAITADAANPVVTKLTTPVDLKGDAGAPFNFGAVSTDVTMEFIVEGDPSANVNGYLAVGENDRSNLRYEQWYETTQAGFTQLGVADYQFTPIVPSPFWPTHITYAYNSVDLIMSIYVNGILAGTASGVSDAFAMPTGQGFLGANPAGDEAMTGTIFRVTVYDELISEESIKAHADAFLSANKPGLSRYDSTIAQGGNVPVARVLSPLTLKGTAGVPFDFGATTGDATFEFILEGDPTFNNSAFLAFGTKPVSSLRYELWDNTGELGFTQGGVADYQFVPGVPSPTQATHIAYVWQPDTTTMTLYVNGVLAGTTTAVSPAFEMPSGLGLLGSAGGATEAMVGTIHRVTVFDEVLAPESILAHAQAFTGAVSAPVLSVSISKALPTVVLSQGVAGKHYRVEYRDSLTGAGNWISLLDIPSLTGTSIQVADPAPITGKAQRYYRAVTVE